MYCLLASLYIPIILFSLIYIILLFEHLFNFLALFKFFKLYINFFYLHLLLFLAQSSSNISLN